MDCPFSLLTSWYTSPKKRLCPIEYRRCAPTCATSPSPLRRLPVRAYRAGAHRNVSLLRAPGDRHEFAPFVCGAPCISVHAEEENQNVFKKVSTARVLSQSGSRPDFACSDFVTGHRKTHDYVPVLLERNGSSAFLGVLPPCSGTQFTICALSPDRSFDRRFRPGVLCPASPVNQDARLISTENLPFISPDSRVWTSPSCGSFQNLWSAWIVVSPNL